MTRFNADPQILKHTPNVFLASGYTPGWLKSFRVRSAAVMWPNELWSNRKRGKKTEKEKDREGERQRCKQWCIDEKGYFGCLLWKWITFKVLLLGWASFVDTYMSVHSATGGHVLPVVRDRFTLCPDTDSHMDSMHEINPSICLATI